MLLDEASGADHGEIGAKFVRSLSHRRRHIGGIGEPDGPVSDERGCQGLGLEEGKRVGVLEGRRTCVGKREVRSMKFGVELPTCTAGFACPVPFSSLGEVIRKALEAEQLGYHEVAGNDHLSTMDYVRRAWPEPPD
jgi:hypothetical protein